MLAAGLYALNTFIIAVIWEAEGAVFPAYPGTVSLIIAASSIALYSAMGFVAALLLPKRRHREAILWLCGLQLVSPVGLLAGGYTMWLFARPQVYHAFDQTQSGGEAVNIPPRLRLTWSETQIAAVRPHVMSYGFFGFGLALIVFAVMTWPAYTNMASMLQEQSDDFVAQTFASFRPVMLFFSVVALVVGVMLLISGRLIQRNRGQVFCLISVVPLGALMVPMGTLFVVATFLVLRPGSSVKPPPQVSAEWQ